MKNWKTDFMLGDAFELTGEWWLPESADQKLYGTLRYARDKLELEVSGIFKAIPIEEQLAGTSNLQEHPCIHGLTHYQQKFTLLRAFVVSQSVTTTYSPIHLIAGKHVSELSALKIQRVSFVCRHLDLFLARNNFKIATVGVKEDFKSHTVQYIQPQAISYRVDEIASRLEFQASLSCSSLPYAQKHMLHAHSYISISPDSPQSLDWFTQNIWRFCYLLTLLADEVISPTGVQMFCSDDDYPGWHLYKSREEQKAGESVTPVFLFHLGHLIDQFESVLNRWFSVDETMLDAIHLTMDAQRNPEHSTEGRFLLLAHAVEVVSRATTSSEYMAPEEYEKVKLAISNSIPNSVSKEHRVSLNKKIEYGNEFSFRKRLKELIRSLNPAAQQLVCRKLGDFSDGVAETRNYYTHFTDELRKKILSPVATYWAS